ncbi:MAG: LytTR family transcriptional regulator [Muribaculaceae bacterium]|nr:LytTR family transcriptional regulator [Muribaculaceae bacterium]
MSKKLIFSSASELVSVPADSVVYIVADGNYSSIVMANGSKYVLTIQLGQMEKRISERIEDNRFVRIGKSLIINRDFITQIAPSRQRLTLSDCRDFHHELSASREALKVLKEFIEKETCHEPD